MLLRCVLILPLRAAKYALGTQSEKLNSYHGISSLLENLKEPAYSKYRMAYHTLQLGIRIEQTWLDWAEEMKQEIQSQC